MAQTTTIRNLLVKLGVDTNEREAQNFDKAVAGVKKTLLAAAAAATAFATAIFGFVKSTARAGDEAAKTAKRMGTTAEAVQELAFAADITGISLSEIENSFKRMSRVVNDAENGLATAQRTVSQLGVSLRDQNGNLRQSVDLFDDFIGALAKEESAVKRSALAQELFGRAGSRMLTMVDAGTHSIGEMRQMARDLGLVMSEEATKESEKFNDSLTMLKGLLTGLRNQIGLAFMPALTDTAHRVRDWYIANRDLIKQRLDRALAKVNQEIKRAAEFARNLWARINDLVERFGGWDRVISTIASAIAAFAAMKAWGAIVVAVKAIGVVIGALSIKVLAVVAIFVGLALAIQDVITYFRGGESVTGALIERFKELTIVERVREWVDSLTDSVGDLWGRLMDGRLGSAIALVQEFWGVLSGALAPVIESLAGLAKSFFRVWRTTMQLVGTIALKIARAIFSFWWNRVKSLVSTFQWAFGIIADVLLWWYDNVVLPIFRLLAPIVGESLSQIVDLFKIAFDALGDVLNFFLDLAQGNFGSFQEAATAALDIVRDHFQRVFDWISARIDSAIGRFNSMRNMAAKIPGLGSIASEGPASDAANQARSQTNQNVAVAAGGNTEINVDASGTNASAEEIASQVAAKQEESFQKRMRQAAQSFFGREL